MQIFYFGPCLSFIANSNVFQDLSPPSSKSRSLSFQIQLQSETQFVAVSQPSIGFPSWQFSLQNFCDHQKSSMLSCIWKFLFYPQIFFQENLHLLNDQSGLSKLYPDPRSGVTMIFILLVLFAKITLEQHFNMPGSNYIPFNLCLKTQKYSRDLESNPGSPALKAACLRTF